MIDECWLPEKEHLEEYGNDWTSYEDALYSIFKKDFIDTAPNFEGKVVQIRKYPIEFGKEEAFFHVTCQDYTKTRNRSPDLRRCERIRWVRAFIENYNCNPNLCDLCDGIKLWSEPHKNTTRVHLLFEEEKYIVVLERRSSYCLLITAYYIDHGHVLEKKLKSYQTYKN